MSSTHCALHYHLIWGTKHQQKSISREWRDRLHAYMGGLVRTAGGVPTMVGGVEDHVHLLVSLTQNHMLCDFLRDIKRQSSAWVHDELGAKKFQWQEGYGAFTVSVSAVETVRHYIENQEEHHRRQIFRDEYVQFLTKHGIEFKEEYLW